MRVIMIKVIKIWVQMLQIFVKVMSQTALSLKYINSITRQSVLGLYTIQMQIQVKWMHC